MTTGRINQITTRNSYFDDDAESTVSLPLQAHNEVAALKGQWGDPQWLGNVWHGLVVHRLHHCLPAQCANKACATPTHTRRCYRQALAGPSKSGSRAGSKGAGTVNLAHGPEYLMLLRCWRCFLPSSFRPASFILAQRSFTLAVGLPGGTLIKSNSLELATPPCVGGPAAPLILHCLGPP